MGKFKRGGYVFRTWRGDHSPRHIHVFKGDRLVLKWNLEAQVPMKGKMTAKLRRLIEQLLREGKL